MAGKLGKAFAARSRIPKAMKSLLFSGLAVLLLGCAFAPVALAQLVAASEGPVAMGHYHLNVSDLAAHRRFWGELLGGEPTKFGSTEVYRFYNALVFLKEKAPEAGTIGSSVNHIGFEVPSVVDLVAKLEKAGVPIVTQREVTGGRAKTKVFHSPSQDIDLAFILGPDDVKVELIGNTAATRAIANHHIHFATPDVPGMQQWYAKMFGATPRKRGPFESADLPGVNLTFSPEDAPQPTKGRALDHIGFEVKDLEAFCKKLEAEGVKFDMPYRNLEKMGLAIAFFTDPWGVYVELTEGLDKL